jgi:hypothetical protein
VCVEGVNFIDSVLYIVGFNIKYLREAPERLIVLKEAYSLIVELYTVVIIALEAEL